MCLCVFYQNETGVIHKVSREFDIFLDPNADEGERAEIESLVDGVSFCAKLLFNYDFNLGRAGALFKSLLIDFKVGT